MEGSHARTPLHILMHFSHHPTLPLMEHRAAAGAPAAGIPLLVELKPARAVTARGLEQ